MRLSDGATRLDATTAPPADVRRAADLFKVLAHPDRLKLACLIGDGRVTTQTELLGELDWPQSTLSRHLTALRHAGLVVGEREGAEVQLRMGSPIGVRLMETVCDWLHEEADEAPSDRRPLGPGLAPSPTPRGAGPSTGDAGGWDR